MSILIENQDMPKEGEKYLIEIRHDGTVYDAIGQRVAAQAVQFESPWHRIEDGMPKPLEMVIAYVDPWHIFAAYHNGHGAWKENDGFNVIGVRYWMPIEPPQEDA